MALSKAINFLKQVESDAEFRKHCNQQTSRDVLLDSFGFDKYEFEDALNMRLVKCQDFEEANGVQQLRLWFTLL